jgi:5'-nucleotidase / UDP-sugar diphosphatase
MSKVFKFGIFIVIGLTVVSFPIFGNESNQVRLTVLHWNDLHAANTPKQSIKDGDTLYFGGYANLAGYINHYRNTLEHTIELNAGDDFQGTPISMITEGQSQIDINEIIQPDAMTIGNHEFDYTWQSLQKKFSEATFPALLGNVIVKESGISLFPADIIVDVDGIKVGIIGVITEDLLGVTTRKATEGLIVLPKADVIKVSLEKLIPITDIQIILSHSGFEEDSLMAVEVGPEVDLIVGGHSHTRLREPKWVNGVPIVQAGSKGKWLGLVDMVIDTSLNRVVSLEGRIEDILVGKYPADKKIEEYVTKSESIVKKEMDVVLAELETDWKRSYSSESNVGNWITDALRLTMDTDIAVVNSGGIRANIEAGPLTKGEILEVCPFGNQIVIFKLSGTEIEEFVKYRGSKHRETLQISGIKFHTIDGNIVELTIDDKPVNKDNLYSVATLNYVSDHFERFFGVTPAERSINTTSMLDRDILFRFARDQKTINSVIENRTVVE